MKRKAAIRKLKQRQEDFDRMKARPPAEQGIRKRMDSGGYHRPGSIKVG
jgi:hypothetical protein